MNVLQVIGSLNRGGAETFIMNVLRNIDGNEHRFIFLCYGDEPFDYEDEARSLGAKIIRIPDIKDTNIVKYINSIRKVIKDESVDIVHAHTYYNSMFALIAARLAGVEDRITHSHSTQSETNPSLIKKLYFRLSSWVIGTLSTARLACGDAAGKALFGARADYTVINNGIKLKDFAFNSKVRSNMRRKLGIPDTNTVLLHVGRFETVKNHTFLIDIYEQYRKLDPNSTLLLVGRGPTEGDMKDKVASLGLSDDIKFLGVRSDVKDLYSAADAFVFPSLFEGLPVVLVEAQANGLPCFISDSIDRGVKIIDSIKFMPLSEKPRAWALSINDSDMTRDKRENVLKGSAYDINIVIKDMERLYEES